MPHNPAPLPSRPGYSGGSPEVLRRTRFEPFDPWRGAGTDLKLRVSFRGKRCEGETMPTKDLTIAMIGSGGDGVVTMGEMLAQAAARDAVNAVTTAACAPPISGGEQS